MPNDTEVGFTLTRFADGRIVLAMGGREYDFDDFAIEIFTMNRNSVLGDGKPVSFHATVRDRVSLEIVASFSTRTGV